MKVKLSLDTMCWNRKPKGKSEIGGISLSVPKNIVEIDIEEFATNVVQPYGKTWCPATFRDEIRSNETFESQQIFCLDIDEGLTIDDMLERCDKYNIIPAFIYTTFSSVYNNNKFRVVFVLEHIIEDKRERELVQLALMKLFPEADKACRDAGHLFFGGKELIYCKHSRFVHCYSGIIFVIVLLSIIFFGKFRLLGLPSSFLIKVEKNTRDFSRGMNFQHTLLK